MPHPLRVPCAPPRPDHPIIGAKKITGQVILGGKITADDMRAMNEAVDGQHRVPAVVVREFRKRKGL
ncbi:MAG TPA: hypothetical protein VMU92_10485 [Acidobacteriaceae bacterium]|nr:hypothetical protein [Acidobacteriaceae bacterium]